MEYQISYISHFKVSIINGLSKKTTIHLITKKNSAQHKSDLYAPLKANAILSVPSPVPETRKHPKALSASMIAQLILPALADAIAN